MASPPIELAADEVTVVTIVVTATDGDTTRTYTIEITRQSEVAFAQHTYLKASNAEAGDSFGTVALSRDGNTLAVGAIREGSNAVGVNGEDNNSALLSGAVYVFTRPPGGVWSQQAYVKASNTRAVTLGQGNGYFFGGSMALSDDGNTLAVGAIGEDGCATGVGGNQNDTCFPQNTNFTGAVYVFTRASGIWSQQAYVKASNAGGNDRFGASVALSGDGNTLAVGASTEDSGVFGVNSSEPDNDNAVFSGAVYVFTRIDNAWSQQAYVKASNTGFNDVFGTSVKLSGDGNTLVVGAPNEQSAARGIDGDQGDAPNPSNYGAVYVFGRAGSTWSQQAYVKASNTAVLTEGAGLFGTVALSSDGNTLAVGAITEDGASTGINGDEEITGNSPLGSINFNSGAVYVFTRPPGGIWSQQAYIKASNTGEGDFFGHSVALSDNGDTLAVGASSEDSNGDPANDLLQNSGAVYVFTRTGNVWSQHAYVKAPNAGVGDQLGMVNSIALSGDGNTLAVGAPQEDSDAVGVGGEDNDLASDSGAAYVFDF